MVKNITTVVPDFQVLADNMQLISDRFRNNVAVMAVKAGIVAVEAAAVRTPVDTGLARSNWQLDSVKTRMVRPSYVTGKRNQGIGERGIYQAVVESAKRAGRSISKEHVCAGRSIWVTNPTPYIDLLNAGSSFQNREGNMDVIAAQLAEGFVQSYIRTGKLLTSVDSI